jgi:hypothetical protein
MFILVPMFYDVESDHLLVYHLLHHLLQHKHVMVHLELTTGGAPAVTNPPPKLGAVALDTAGVEPPPVEVEGEPGELNELL